MHNLATALAITLSYLDGRSSNSTEDDDVEVLEAAAAELQTAPSDEKNSVNSALVHIGRADLADGLGLN